MSEHAVAQPQRANTPQEATKGPSLLQRRHMNEPEPTTLQEWFFDTASGAFAEPRVGYDFSRVPALTGMKRQTQPFLRTQPGIQRFPKDEDEGSVPCLTCPEAEAPETSTTAEPIVEEAPPAPEAAPTPTEAEPTTEETTPEESTAPGLIVEDSAETVGPGQIRRSGFLAQLRTEVTRAAEAALAGTGRTTAECPYLEYWFSYYSRQDSLHLERAIRRYAPETAHATTARDYIPIIAERVRRSVEIWARTGEITGIPKGLSMGMLGIGLLGGIGGLISGIGGIFFKAREGGARAADNPEAIQAELGEGQPLEGAVRSRMESAFGMDFAHVRTHTDTTAAGLSNRFNARAFTVGKNIAFGSGEYKPGTLIGDALIAHELAHVVQQGGTSASVAHMKVGDMDNEALETDADESAVGAVTSLWNGTKKTISGITENAMPRLRSGLRLQRCAATRTATPTAESPGAQVAKAPAATAGPCGQSSKARTYTPTDISSRVTLGSNQFGNTSKLAAQFTYGACSSGGNWHFYLDTLAVRIGSAVQPMSFRTNVESATDPDVTRTTYQAIMDDLRPNRTARIRVTCGGNSWIDTVHSYSRRRVYWKRQFVVDHEAFHRRDWDRMYRPELIRAEGQIWAHNIPENAARSATLAIQRERSSLDAYMIAAYQNTCRAYTPQQETRAYNDGASQYQSLVDTIQSRAGSEGW